MKSENLPLILPEYIIEAAEQLDKIDLENFNKATKHHVIVKGKSYPPKELLIELAKLIKAKNLNIDLGSTTVGITTNVIFENAGFEIIAFKVDIPPLKDFQLLIDLYKKLVKEDNNTEEVYKWEAVKHFQFHWDVVNQEFGSVLKRSFAKRQNLMYQVSSWFLDILATQYPKEAREMFVRLYNEDRDLNERIKNFQSASDDIIKKVSQKLNKKLHHQQDERAISFYLALRYPDKHIIYMSDVYTRLCAYLDLKPYSAGKKYAHFLELSESIASMVRHDIELQQTVADTLTELSWKDGDQSNLITQDILYRTLKDHPEMVTESSIINGSAFDITSDQINNFKKTMSLNTILYGPPGTGKTYHTINKALEILGEDLSEKSRSEIKELFDEKVAEGQIVFTTFHQSMSYEDFIEGIKPKTTTEKAVIYEIENGIFKSLCNEARNHKRDRLNTNEFEIIYQQLLNDIDNAPDHRLTFKMKTQSKEFTIFKKNDNTIHFFRESKKTYTDDIRKDALQHYLETGKTLKDWSSFVKPIGDYLIKTYNYRNVPILIGKSFVLIIDEINRGNVSQIFGELITLIEDDKRQGKKEAISVILPYSKESFSVPSNLYIIGTMNTADRSVEAVDTALRRRFTFEEVCPMPALLEPYAVFCRFSEKYSEITWEDWQKQYSDKALRFYDLFDITNIKIASKTDISYYDIAEQNKFQPELCKPLLVKAGLVLKPTIDISLLLSTLNKRIEILKDRDHQIGHSYFMNVESLPDLINVFKESIIPLLQEYFFGDYKKIQLILGLGFISENRPDINFATNDEGEFDDKVIYSIRKEAFYNEANFMKALAEMKLS